MELFLLTSLISFNNICCRVGLLRKDMKAVLKKYGARFVILGVLITFIGGSMTYAMTLLSSDKGSSAYEVSGVYTGALTSSPGLGRFRNSW